MRPGHFATRDNVSAESMNDRIIEPGEHLREEAVSARERGASPPHVAFRFRARLTGETSGEYDYQQVIRNSANTGWQNATNGVTSTSTGKKAREVHGWQGIPSDASEGFVVWIDAVVDANGAIQYVFDVGYGDDGTRATVGTTAETQAAQTDTWDRDSQSSNRGVTVTMQTRTAYDHTSGQTLYAYYRDFEYDANGNLMSVSAETRVTVDTPTSEACA